MNDDPYTPPADQPIVYTHLAIYDATETWPPAGVTYTTDESDDVCEGCADDCKIWGWASTHPECGDPHMCKLPKDHDGPHVCEECDETYETNPDPNPPKVTVVELNQPVDPDAPRTTITWTSSGIISITPPTTDS